MDDLVYPRERTLGIITLVLGLLLWLALIVGTVGVALVALGIGFVLYLFAHSTLIAHIKGNGVELSAAQFPDLYEQFTSCCERLQIKEPPAVYILNGNGGFNAFATKFLGAQFVVLLSDVVDAMNRHPDGVRFYIGHELGHLRMKHLRATFLRWPALWLPLLGAAYSRARESTCDRHGRACCASPEGAVRALAALAAGPQRWEPLDVAAYGRQIRHCSGFWMSFHELTSGYPWLTKRAARVMDPVGKLPRRSAFAYFPAALVPYFGRMGAGFSFLLMVYLVVVLAAIAVPAYQDYIARAKVSAAIDGSQGARNALGSYYIKNQKIPESLAVAGVTPELVGGAHLSLEQKGMVLTVSTPQGELIFTPSADGQERIIWNCSPGAGLKPTQLPPTCRGATPVSRRN
ncbi:M48 family metalloprotease [uncultured Thiodictyon sp.]|jgi:Zn-dependent protease with chaperone function/type II secretory pathway pseudopilin PulG|uniref:M48 family metalloprotease n=1 Tax=uncultured Thiodictyon sp. TaxID=1846217 RepID=UPI0025ED64A2|nr:M48 family metalloprotease [uncultured Thiodictyon sp.]